MSRCWICFDEDDSSGGWVKPCQCTLTAHEQCLLDWISETEKNSAYLPVQCPQCAMPYVIADTVSTVLAVLVKGDHLIRAIMPFIMFLGLSFTAWITSTAYGTLSVLMFLGTEQSEQLMGPPAQWSGRTWLAMSLIPILLVACNFRWSDGILPLATLVLLRTAGSPIHPILLAWPPSVAAIVGVFPWIRLLYNNMFNFVQCQLPLRMLNNSGNMSRRDVRQLLGDQNRHAGVSIIHALLWPIIGTFIGSCMSYTAIVQQYFPDPFHRNLLGGCAYAVVKDLTSLLYDCERIRQRQSRRVRNFDEIPLATTTTHCGHR